MSLVNIDVNQFVERRAMALASVFLTSHPGPSAEAAGLVQVSGIELGSGLDLLAEINTPDEGRALIFGVILNGTVQLLPTPEAAATWLEQSSLSLRRRSYPFPVIELVFSMNGDRGYYAWRSEPVFAGQGQGRLIVPKLAECREAAGRRSLVEIVARVQAWYRFFYGSMTA